MNEAPSPSAQPFDSKAREAVTQYCRSHLVGPVFTQIEPLWTFDDDPDNLPRSLELLAGWEDVTKRTFKGTGWEGREYTTADLEAVASIADHRTDADLVIRVATLLSLPLIGAGRSPNGRSLSPRIYLQLFCSDVHPSRPALDTQAFWQVNLGLVLPDELAFQRNILSYGLLELLHPVMERIHPWLHIMSNKLVLHYPLHPDDDTNDITVTLTLTVNPFELFSWLGLDVEGWDAGFQSRRDVVRWLADVSVDSVIGQQWIGVASRVEERRQRRMLDGTDSEARVKASALGRHLWSTGWATRERHSAEAWGSVSKTGRTVAADKLVSHFKREDLLHQLCQRRTEQEEEEGKQEEIRMQALQQRRAMGRADQASYWRRKA